ncbi:MAG: ribonuclease HIII [Victivallales bacterium]|nr:ribonuclease HIII [Victivallales bacterium]
MPTKAPQKVTSHVVKLTPEQIAQFRAKLESSGWTFSELAYGHWKAQKEHTSVAAYHSGKVVIQGSGTQDLVLYVLEPEVLHEARLGYEGVWSEQENPQMFEPHAGIDESGKGDFFGPLVIACAFTARETAQKLLEVGVKDSKMISSDQAMFAIARQIHAILQGRFCIITISPATLNQLYGKIGNLNRILAWGHARALENLLEKAPDCPRAISDQFGQGNLVHRALMERGSKIMLDEHPKAEADIAVAAASILAREKYVQEMKKLSSEAGLLLPKGAGPKVTETAKEFLKLHPRTELTNYAKTFFKTMDSL